MKKSLARLIKGIIAAASFLGALLGLQWPLLGALLLGGGAYLGSGLFIRSPRTRQVLISGSGYVPLPAGERPDTSLDKSQVAKDGRELLKQIRLSSVRIANSDFRERVARICDVGESVIRHFEEEPHNVVTARKFVDYYLATTLKIVILYRDLSAQPQHSEQERTILEKAEQVLPHIEAGFQRQVSRLQEDSFLDLDTELAVLETTMKTEDF